MKSEKRIQKIFSVLSRRQPDLTLVIENIHDPHNVSAILRSADAVGIHEIQLVYTKDTFPKIGKKSSSSANKWIERRKFTSIAECYDALRKEGFSIIATRLDEKAESLYAFDLTKKTALVFGNEHDGVSEEAAHLADGTLMIPMMGMIQSLNVSVACAVVIFEAMRQRKHARLYTHPRFTPFELEKLKQQWLEK